MCRVTCVIGFLLCLKSNPASFLLFWLLSCQQTPLLSSLLSMMHPMGEEDSPNLGEGGGGEKRKDVAEFEIRCVKVEQGLSGKCSKGCCPKLYVTGKKKKKKRRKKNPSCRHSMRCRNCAPAALSLSLSKRRGCSVQSARKCQKKHDPGVRSGWEQAAVEDVLQFAAATFARVTRSQTNL